MNKVAAAVIPDGREHAAFKIGGKPFSQSSLMSWKTLASNARCTAKRNWARGRDSAKGNIEALLQVRAEREREELHGFTLLFVRWFTYARFIAGNCSW